MKIKGERGVRLQLVVSDSRIERICPSSSCDERRSQPSVEVIEREIRGDPCRAARSCP